MADLSGLGNIAGAAAGGVPLAQIRWAEAQRAQQEAEQGRREALAQQIFGSIGPDLPDLTQLPGGQSPGINAPPPGAASQPMTMNQAFAPPPAAGPTATAGVPPGSPPGGFPGAAVPQPSIAGSAGAPAPAGGGANPQGGQQPGLGALMQYLRQKNPGADPASIGMAAQRMWALMSPIQQQRLALQEQYNQARINAQIYGVDTRARTAQDQIKSREDIAAMNDQTRKWLKSAGGGGAAKETPGERAQHAYIAGQIANLQRQINTTYLQNSSDPGLPAMYQRLNALGAQLDTFNAGVAGRLGGGGGGAGGTAQPAASAGGGATPESEGAPDPKTLPDGRTGTTSDGRKWITKGGAWVKTQ